MRFNCHASEGLAGDSGVAGVVMGEESGGGMTAGLEWWGSGDTRVGAENREEGLFCWGGTSRGTRARGWIEGR